MDLGQLLASVRYAAVSPCKSLGSLVHKVPADANWSLCCRCSCSIAALIADYMQVLDLYHILHGNWMSWS